MSARLQWTWHRLARHKAWSGATRPEGWHPRVGTRRFLLWHVFCYPCAVERVNGPFPAPEATR